MPFSIVLFQPIMINREEININCPLLITFTNKRMDGGLPWWWFHRDRHHCTLRIASRDHPGKKGKADGLSTLPVIFH